MGPRNLSEFDSQPYALWLRTHATLVMDWLAPVWVVGEATTKGLQIYDLYTHGEQLLWNEADCWSSA